MHVAAKLTLGVGVGMLVLGILLGGLGARGVGSATDWSVEEEAIWSGSSGVHDHTDARDGVLYIFVSDEVRCDEFTLNVSVIEGDSDQKVWYTADWCTEDGKLPMGYADDPDGWLHMGDVRGLESGGSYEFVSEDNLIAVPEGVIIELIESLMGYRSKAARLNPIPFPSTLEPSPLQVGLRQRLKIGTSRPRNDSVRVCF